MAQETAIHRADVEGALGVLTPVDTELAVDGIDEVLTRMLAGDWSDEVQRGPTRVVDVAAGGRGWRVAMSPAEVVVHDLVGEAQVGVSGDPSNVLLWLWGRAAESVVQVVGDPAAARQLRGRVSVATQ